MAIHCICRAFQVKFSEIVMISCRSSSVLQRQSCSLSPSLRSWWGGRKGGGIVLEEGRGPTKAPTAILSSEEEERRGYPKEGLKFLSWLKADLKQILAVKWLVNQGGHQKGAYVKYCPLVPVCCLWCARQGLGIAVTYQTTLVKCLWPVDAWTVAGISYLCWSLHLPLLSLLFCITEPSLKHIFV